MAFNWKGFFSLRRTSEETVSSARRGFSISAGMVVTEDTAMKVSAFYRGVTYISTQVAKLPWQVKDKDNKIIRDSRVGTLLDLQPNPEMTAMTFRIWAISTAIIKGNAYAEIERDMVGRPINIWPLPTANVTPTRIDGKLKYEITGSSTQGRLFIEPENILHIKNFHTSDGIIGQGVVAYAMRTLGISLGADNMASNLFGNGGIPSGVLKHPGTLSEEAYSRIKSSWKEEHTGSKSAGIALLEEGLEFEPINIDPTVLQFLESRKFGVLEIARFLGLPPTKLFDMSNATYSNVENANLEVATDTLDAWARNLESEADIKLLNKRFGGKFSQLDLQAVFRGDMASRSTYFKNMMAVGSMTPNEIREKESMAPYKDGDRYYIATNNYSPADRIDELLDAQIKNGTKPEKTEEEQESEQALVNAATKMLNKR